VPEKDVLSEWFISYIVHKVNRVVINIIESPLLVKFKKKEKKKERKEKKEENVCLIRVGFICQASRQSLQMNQCTVKFA